MLLGGVLVGDRDHHLSNLMAMSFQWFLDALLKESNQIWFTAFTLVLGLTSPHRSLFGYLDSISLDALLLMNDYVWHTARFRSIAMNKNDTTRVMNGV